MRGDQWFRLGDQGVGGKKQEATKLRDGGESCYKDLRPLEYSAERYFAKTEKRNDEIKIADRKKKRNHREMKYRNVNDGQDPSLQPHVICEKTAKCQFRVL